MNLFKKNIQIVVVVLLLPFFTFCSDNNCKTFTDEKPQIINVLKLQEAAWNKGDLEGYMQGYWKSDSLRFASGGNVKYGWQKTLDGYIKGYPNKDIMGRLEFSKLEITQLTNVDAIVFGQWKLFREKDEPWGLFTLLFKKTNGNWKVIADHTSAAGE